MTNEEFEKLFEEIVKQERETLITKAREYAGNGDRLWNFVSGAGITGLSPTETAWGYMSKQLASVRDMCVGKKASRTMIREKVGDCRNYLALIEALLVERDGVK